MVVRGRSDVFVDTGGFIALVHKSDREHERAVQWYNNTKQTTIFYTTNGEALQRKACGFLLKFQREAREKAKDYTARPRLQRSRRTRRCAYNRLQPRLHCCAPQRG